MGSPAGFLNFQGHNAINDGHQYVSMNFSYNLNDSLAFDDTLNDFAYAGLTTCDYKTTAPEVHNFTVQYHLLSLAPTAHAIPASRPVMPTTASSIRNLMSWKGSTIRWWAGPMPSL
jgi:hypothetical protein